MKNLIPILLISILFSACKKEEVDETVPNAVMHNFTLEIKYDEWIEYVQDGYRYYEGNVEIPEITDKVISGGAILAFMEYEDVYYSLPMIFGNNGVHLTYLYAFEESYFYPAVMISNVNFNWNVFSVKYKLVIIEELPPTDLNISDYQDVKKYYNID